MGATTKLYQSSLSSVSHARAVSVVSVVSVVIVVSVVSVVSAAVEGCGVVALRRFIYQFIT